jgi:hypothetical protein
VRPSFSSASGSFRPRACLFSSGAQAFAVAAFGAVAMGLLYFLLRPVLREDPTARFFLFGMTLAVVPITATLPLWSAKTRSARLEVRVRVQVLPTTPSLARSRHVRNRDMGVRVLTWA